MLRFQNGACCRRGMGGIRHWKNSALKECWDSNLVRRPWMINPSSAVDSWIMAATWDGVLNIGSAERVIFFQQKLQEEEDASGFQLILGIVRDIFFQKKLQEEEDTSGFQLILGIVRDEVEYMSTPSSSSSSHHLWYRQLARHKLSGGQYSHNILMEARVF